MKTHPLMIGLGEILWDIYPDAARFGGAPANFACHAASLGAEAWVASAVGTDELGDKAIQELQQHGVVTEAVARDPEHPTGAVYVRGVKGGHVDYEFNPNAAWDHLAWSDALDTLAKRADVVCFGSLGQRSPESRETIRRLVQAAPVSAWLVFDVNLRQEFYDAETIASSLNLATVFKLNDAELPIVARLLGLPKASPRDTMQGLARAYDLRLVALTRGDQGSLLLANGQFDECSAQSVTLVDPVGAGDAFTAALVSSLWRGVPLASAHFHASAVAAYVCSQKGATPALPPVLRSFPTISSV